jgi:Holliday junction resolvase
VTEREWQRTVMALLELHGWGPIYHTWSSVHSPAGFPDLIAVRDNRILAIECKTQKGKVTDAQRKWLGALDGVKVIEAFVSRPAPDLSELEQVMA